MSIASLLAFLYFLYGLPLGSGKTLEVKFAEGNNRKPDRGLSEKNYYLEHKEPEGTLYGPEALFFLNGQCFSTTLDRYLYTVCPFQNVTMRRITASRATLIGYWKEWGEGYTSQFFSAGQPCGVKTRTAEVKISCGPSDDMSPIRVPASSITEEGSCHHIFTLNLLIACRLLREDIIPEHISTSSVAASLVKNELNGFAPQNEPDPSAKSPSHLLKKVETIDNATSKGNITENATSNNAKHSSLVQIQRKIDELQQAMAELLQ